MSVGDGTSAALVVYRSCKCMAAFVLFGSDDVAATSLGYHAFYLVFIQYFLLGLQLAKDLLNPSPEEEKRRHKKKRLVQSPNSYFMDVKCPGCYKITTVFSHAQTVVLCVGCSTVLCQPTGGRARLTEGKHSLL
ncbi:small ribosomal subunit protein eS27-like [Saccoglossus kowalevskii]